MKLREKLRDAVSIEGKVSKRKLFAKLLITFVASIWTLVFLGVMLSLGSPLLDYFESQQAEDLTISVVAIWFLFTVVVTAVYLVYRIYNAVLGQWSTKKNDED